MIRWKDGHLRLSRSSILVAKSHGAHANLVLALCSDRLFGRFLCQRQIPQKPLHRLPEMYPGSGVRLHGCATPSKALDRRQMAISWKMQAHTLLVALLAASRRLPVGIVLVASAQIAGRTDEAFADRPVLEA